MSGPRDEPIRPHPDYGPDPDYVPVPLDQPFDDGVPPPREPEPAEEQPESRASTRKRA
ncbi:hypothetical protein [uncultured Alsobacter sp.]|uniref:hypothetical protein n=1 Tax=uncultured Alsobacter sp. TaxID=1748258 RepID=UPI0025D0ECEA|nr:hypothetical protein [uncultured Alsobacter sp.]